METTSNNNGRLFAALLGGLAAGALLGVLLAPNKGSETRRKIVDETKKAGDKVKGKFREVYEAVSGSGGRMNDMA